MSLWVPILICTHWLLCDGKPIEGKPVSSYETCQEVLKLQRELFSDTEFMDRHVISKCEKR